MQRVLYLKVRMKGLQQRGFKGMILIIRATKLNAYYIHARHRSNASLFLLIASLHNPMKTLIL